MTNMQATIRRAADHIDTHPWEYDYATNDSPAQEGYGCMLGWVGHFAGLKDDKAHPHCYTHQVALALGFPHMTAFFQQLERIMGHFNFCSASIAADALRRYADALDGTEEIEEEVTHAEVA